MKFVLKESQLKKILLKESSDFSKFPCVNSLPTVSRELSSNRVTDFKKGTGLFKDFMFEDNGDFYVRGVTAGLYSCGKKSNEVVLKYYHGKKQTILLPVSEENQVIKVNQSCKSTFNKILPQAKNWWYKWLDAPQTKERFKKNYSDVAVLFSDSQVDSLFTKYKNAIKNLQNSFFDNTMKQTPERVSLDGMSRANAFVSPRVPNKVFVNCSQINTERQKFVTLVHEMQHIISDIYPLSPDSKVKSAFKTNKKGLAKLTQYTEKIPWEFSNLGRKYGIPKETLGNWMKYLEDEKKGEDPGYICRETEKLSNIIGLRALFGLESGEDITIDMLLPHIKEEEDNSNSYWLILCWLENGAGDINQFLKNFNQLAYQKLKQQGQENNTEFV